MASNDRGYSVLLSHLHTTETRLPLATIQAALSHHLASASPVPTPLAATAITSPFYLSQPFTYEKLQSFSIAFRHASHLKYRNVVKAFRSHSMLRTYLGRSMQAIMAEWVTDVLKGIQGGHSVLRLVASSGLLLGVEDLKVGEQGEKKEGIDVGNARWGVEDETIVALAEVMDVYASGISSSSSSTGIEEWEKEFQPAGQDVLSLALIFASQSLPLVSEDKLKAFPLPTLSRLLISTVSATFKSGSFLSSASASVTLTPEHHVSISATSPMSQTLHSMASSPLATSIASVSRLTANILSLLLDVPSTYRLTEGLYTISESLDIMREMAKQIERDWISCPLSSCADQEIGTPFPVSSPEHELMTPYFVAQDTKDLTKLLWTMLKTLLFTCIMIFESVLSSLVYLPPQPYQITPASLAVQVLETLSHLSFIISEFGGVTTTTQGFEQLKKTFYLALDVLAQGDGPAGDSGLKADTYVQTICFALNSQRVESVAAGPRQAKQAFVLASIEQLIPVLSDRCIRDWVWGVCYPHLSDPSHRETYESSHSVVLAIFASHAQRQQADYAGAHNIAFSDIESSDPENQASPGGDQESKPLKRLQDSRKLPMKSQARLSTDFFKRMVPFYAECLIDNSKEGRLNTSQLRLAYSALVRSATVSAFMSEGEKPDETYTLAWYCIQLLLDTIHQQLPPAGSKGKGKAVNTSDPDRLQRLLLMLISSVSSVPLPLMMRTLDEIRTLLTSDLPPLSGSQQSKKDKERREEVLEALFEEILEKTGDREKEAAMRWWYTWRPHLLASPAEDKEDGGLFSWFSARKKKRVETQGTQGEELKNSNASTTTTTTTMSRL
ncbi:hypothetical protein CVT24_001669 [Panaeolus cyanescens]|uniref:Uncharacterized protein n=1 Tax=Panaeolus cyanescens TaxID=181874 RepID=A0A409VST9_9AGAR|nr:hypothetical protein CVT24_001669 [Panaeolus cyanescens]